ncbi:sigma-54-dependent Fis family transcriptional regulator [candidate division KSB1 bacterium]|nr:sigma-54-dependent Fis family transcriptional regulator [candidate division KSB1 bacterium]
MKLNQVIIVEDNDTMRLAMVESLRRKNYEIFEFDNGRSALEFFSRQQVPLVISDLKMEPIDGFELMEKLKAENPATEILMISAFGTVEKAVKAMQLGAADFITKPFSSEELRIRVKKILKKIEQSRKVTLLQEENLLLNQDLSIGYDNMIGSSPALKHVFSLIDRVAKENSTVLIEGASGTGKELVARAICKQSNRRDKPFIKINCGALNENLLESELFGHEKGAFTGASKQKRGRFELADKGTFFLDEIGDISNSLQVKLLRVIQEMDFERVGGEQTISVDVRLITATHQDLQKLVETGKFREDLYYRLNVFPIKLPLLQERKEDIPALVEYFLTKMTQKSDSAKKQISQDGMRILMEHSWPGNIRELENLIERLWVISEGTEINPMLISQHLIQSNRVSSKSNNYDLETAVYHFEKNLIQDALTKTNGVKNRAAKLLRINTSTLYYKMEKFGFIDANEKKER